MNNSGERPALDKVVNEFRKKVVLRRGVLVVEGPSNLVKIVPEHGTSQGE